MFKRLSPALVVAQVVAILVLFAAPGFAATETSHSYSNQVINGNLSVTGTTTLTGTVNQTGNQAVTGNLSVSGTLGVTGVATFTAKPVLSTATISANGDTITIQDLGNANLVQSEGAQTINGVKTFGSAPVITGGLPAAQIQTGSAKRQLLRYHFAPNVATGTVADGTTYRALLFPGRAGTVTRAGWGCITAPVGGTSTLKILKASSAGNTMLSTATVDPTTLTDNTFTPATLTATGADLAITATQGIYVELVAGTQTTDAVDVEAVIEFEPTDF